MLNPKDLQISNDGAPWVKFDLTRQSLTLSVSKDGAPWVGYFPTLGGAIILVSSVEYSGGFDSMNGGFDD